MLELHSVEAAAQWLRSRISGTLRADSRKVQPGDGFIAWPGAATDAREHVGSALQRGAAACLLERAGVERYAFGGANIASYEQLKAASGPIANAYFDQPSRELAVLAVTGTNGKTSTACWLAQALSNLKDEEPLPCGVIGTLGIGPPHELAATGLTTPDPVLLQQSLRRFVTAGMKACALEASSIGIEEHRLDGTHIQTAIFTNFTQDHLDYHGTMQAYWQAKERLFSWPGLRSAVINVDDERGAALAPTLQGQLSDVWTTSCRGAARLRAGGIGYDASGLRFTVIETMGTAQDRREVRAGIIGSYNVANLLGVLAAMRSLGVPLGAAVAVCADLAPVPGRMQCVAVPGQPLAVVDYAHTPDALGKALLALRPLADQRGGALWCIFGCGGDRDASKRPLMGAIAASHADHVVVTSDNPRSERPEAIISQILLGLAGRAAITVEPDRALAIAQTLGLAAERDVLLIAGKGHEDYQEIAGQRLAFSDLAQVRRALAGRAAVPRAEERSNA